MVEIYTIGFTKKGAEEFFALLDEAKVDRLVDTRLRNRSQLAGFAKRDDLIYFLDEIAGVEYKHKKALAPTKELLDDWRDDSINWQQYEDRFFSLMEQREVEKELKKEYFDDKTVLLCSEHDPSYCHRRLVIEYLDNEWDDVEAIHLM